MRSAGESLREILAVTHTYGLSTRLLAMFPLAWFLSPAFSTVEASGMLTQWPPSSRRGPGLLQFSAITNLVFAGEPGAATSLITLDVDSSFTLHIQ